MDSNCEQKKMKVEIDRLSSLPEGLIHKILSFIGTKHVVQTSALSSKWRYTWTSMPYLDFSSDDFVNLTVFSKFVTRVLSSRNNEVEVSSLKLRFRKWLSQGFVKRVVNYAVSHNVQQMNVTCLLEKDIEFPLSLFSSPSVKHLSLRGCGNGFYINLTSTWELPALTTLHLSNVTLSDDSVFSKCANLKNITLKRYRTTISNCFTICHPQLSNLTLENEDWTVEVVNVVAPQLENLTIKTYQRKCQYLVSAPNLTSLVCKGYASLQLKTDGIHLLEKAHICVSSPFCSDAHRIVWLLEQLNNVKSLTLNLEVVEVLSSSMELISHPPVAFANLKNLSIYPVKLEKSVLRKEKVTISTVINKYLLDSCPGANITMVSREEIAAVRNATRARKIITDLRVFLEDEKANYEIDMAEIDRGKEPTENHKTNIYVDAEPQPDEHMQLQIGENMKQIENSWKDLIAQTMQKNDIARNIISELQSIEKLLAQLPASNRAMVHIFMNKMIDGMKINCDA